MSTNTVDPIVNIILPLSKVNVVLAGLRELPYKHSAELINSISAQARREVDRQQEFLSAGATMTEPTQAATSSQQPES